MWVLSCGRIGIWSVSAEGGKPENPEKNLSRKARTNNKLNAHYAGPCFRSARVPYRIR